MHLIVRARLHLVHALQGRLLATGHPERGDVPGWVLVTLMTAGLVVVLWELAGNELKSMFSEALAGVTGPGGN